MKLFTLSPTLAEAARLAAADERFRELAHRLGVPPLNGETRGWAFRTSDGKDAYDIVALMLALLDKIDGAA